MMRSFTCWINYARCCAVSLLDDGPQKDASKPSSNERPEHRHDGVAPIRGPLACNGQYCVGEARPEVPSGIDRITGGSAERKPDAPDQRSNKIRTKSRRRTRNGDRLGEDSADDQNQNE